MGEAGPGALTDQAVFDALPRAVVVTDTTGIIRYWNALAEELYGWAVDEVLGRPIGEILEVLDSEPTSAEPDRLRTGIREGTFTIRHRNGQPLRLLVLRRAVVGPDGQVIGNLGAAEEITEAHLLERLADDLTAQLKLTLEAGELGTWRWDRATGHVAWDERMEQLCGLAPGEFGGTFEDWAESLHPEDRARCLEAVDRAVVQRDRFVLEHRVTWPDGSIRWLEGKGQVTVSPFGEVMGAIGCTADVTERVLAEQDRRALTEAAVQAARRERLSRERMEFLGQINAILADARQRDAVLRSITRAAVPRLGDWCAIHVLADDDLDQMAMEIAHVDPEMVTSARELLGELALIPEMSGLASVIRTGEAEFYPDITPDMFDGLDLPAPALASLQRLAIRSAIIVPLIKYGRILGAMQFVMSDTNRRYTDEDLALALAVAGRIASGLENLRLAEQQRQIAGTLQASLLPGSLPDISGVDIAVRYWATGEGIEVGGDFYDVFPGLQDGEWAVAIGDACGTGPAAAALTGMVRHTLRSAVAHQDDPVRALAHVNQAILNTDSGSFCTAILARLRTPAEGGSGTGCEVSFASGGHPLPILVPAEGPARSVGSPGTLLGIYADATSTPESVALHPGDSLVLYTDGISDVPPPHGLGEHEVVELVCDALRRADTAEQGVDNLQVALERVLPIVERDDDIALMVLRVR